jgi:hypothetical protein
MLAGKLLPPFHHYIDIVGAISIAWALRAGARLQWKLPIPRNWPRNAIWPARLLEPLRTS